MRLLSSLFSFLNTNCQYAVLRNYEHLPHENLGRDIDIIINRHDFNKNKSEIINLFLSDDCKIVSYYNLERVAFIFSICTERGYSLLQIDFIFECAVKSVMLLSGDVVLNRRLYNGKIYHVTKEDEFLCKFLYNTMLGYDYPDKYQQLRQEVENTLYVTNTLCNIFGDKTMNINKSNHLMLLLRCWILNLCRCSVAQIRGTIHYLMKKVSNLTKPSGFTISFTGSDGAGKTTVINIIHDIISKTHSVDVHHFRPTITPNTGMIVYNVGLGQKPNCNFHNPYRAEKKTSMFSSIIRSVYYSFDYILGYYVKVYPAIVATRIVIFDRYYTDIVTDSRRSRIFLNYKFLYWWGRFFIPSLRYNILLTADTNLILSRKQELDKDSIALINLKINYLSRKKGYFLIKNNHTPEETAIDILRIIFEKQHIRNMKKIQKR